MDLKELLQKRKEIKRRKPTFVMQDAHKMKRLAQHWRKPRGTDSKIRLNLKGYNKRVQPGYGSPKEVKFMDPKGLMPVQVANVADLEKIDKKTQGALVLSGVGKRKKVEIIKKAKELEIVLLNVKDADKFVTSVTEKLNARKAEKVKREEKKSKRKQEKKEEKKEEIADKVATEEDKAAQEKKEKDKVLTKKEI